MLVEERLFQTHGLQIKYCKNGCGNVVTDSAVTFARRHGTKEGVCLRCSETDFRSTLAQRLAEARRFGTGQRKDFADTEVTLLQVVRALGISEIAVKLEIIRKDLVYYRRIDKCYAIDRRSVLDLIRDIKNKATRLEVITPKIYEKLYQNIDVIEHNVENGALN